MEYCSELYLIAGKGGGNNIIRLLFLVSRNRSIIAIIKKINQSTVKPRNKRWKFSRFLATHTSAFFSLPLVLNIDIHAKRNLLKLDQIRIQKLVGSSKKTQSYLRTRGEKW